MRKSLVTAALVFCAASSLFGQGQELPGLPPQDASIVHEISKGVYQLGRLVIDQNSRSATFPGALNMDKGPLEYLLVTPAGNAHESLLVTSDLQPSDLHLGMLLLDAKGAGMHTPDAKEAAPSQISKEYLQHAPKLTGDPIDIFVTWQTSAGEERKTRVEEWIFNTSTRKPAERGTWVYNGSMFTQDGRFMAQIDGNFAALVTNPGALINNPRKGSDDDQIWEVNSKVVPPVKTPLKITIQMVETEKSSGPEKTKKQAK